jgi:hypothetical protein
MAPDYDIRRIEVIDDETAAMYRGMTPGQRLRIGLRAGATARRMVEAGVRHQHPGWDAERVREEVLRRMAGGTR